MDLASRVYLNESVSWNVGFALTMDPLSISASLGVEALALLSLDPSLCHLAAWTHRRRQVFNSSVLGRIVGQRGLERFSFSERMKPFAPQIFHDTPVVFSGML